MSAAFALIRFKKTGNIYYGCYEGTSDTMIPYICTPMECYNKDTDCYCAISYCRELSNKHRSWKFPDDVTDLDEAEIYSDYGGGFYWNDIGSESIKMLKPTLNEWGELALNGERYGMPQWAKEFLEKLEENE